MTYAHRVADDVGSPVRIINRRGDVLSSFFISNRYKLLCLKVQQDPNPLYLIVMQSKLNGIVDTGEEILARVAGCSSLSYAFCTCTKQGTAYNSNAKNRLVSVVCNHETPLPLTLITRCPLKRLEKHPWGPRIGYHGHNKGEKKEEQRKKRKHSQDVKTQSEPRS